MFEIEGKDVYPRTVLIAGGCGFLGSWLAHRHFELGCRVICVDNLETGRMENVSELSGQKNFEFIHHDIIDPLHIEGPIHEIYNMACAASPPKYQANPIHTLQTNIAGVTNLLELAIEKQARFLQSSTSEIYGDPELNPQREDYFGNVNTFGPRSCYDEGKRVAETLIREYHLAHGVEARIARIFNTYGPRMRPDDGRVISNFVVQALLGEDITIHGEGNQTRSFCYVEDQIDGLMALMACEGWHSPVNIGNPEEHSVKDIARIVMQMTHASSGIVHLPLPQDDPMVRRPSIDLAHRLLDWRPKVALQQGLKDTIEYFQKEIQEGALCRTAAE